jgi:hypothetical protein
MRERYGLDRSATGRRLGAVALIVAFLAVLVFVTVGVTSNPVDSRLVAWDDVAPDRVDLTISVKRPADAEVTCVMRAQDENRIDLGYATVVLPPGDGDVLLDYSMRTIAPAYAAELLGCSIDGPPSVAPPQFPPGVVPPAQPY